MKKTWGIIMSRQLKERENNLKKQRTNNLKKNFFATKIENILPTWPKWKRRIFILITHST